MGILKDIRIEDKISRKDLYPEKEKKNKKKNKGGVLGGIGYTLGNIGTGVASVFENVGDAIGGTIADLSGNDRAAAYIYGRSTVGEWNQSLDEWYNPSKFMQGVGDVAGGVGQSLTYAATAAIPIVGPKISLGVIAASGFGGGVSSAYQKTGELGAKEYAYGALSGATELALEKFVGSTLSAGTRAAGQGASKGASLLGKNLTKSAARKGFLKTTFTEASEEFLEEFASSYTDTLWLNLTGVDKGASTSFGDAFYNGMIGFFSGGLMSGASQGIRNGMNYSRGKRIMDNGNAQTMFNTSKYISETLGLDELIQKGESDKEIRNRLTEKEVQLNNAMKAYNALEDKTGAKAALYLGEMQETVAMMETQAKAFYNAETYKKTMEANPVEAERYAEIVSTVTGVKVSAEDIKSNKPLLGDFGAMDTLGMIGVVGKYLNDKKTNYEARQADEALKESVVDLSNVGAQTAEAETAAPTVAPTMQKAVNAKVNPSVAPNVNANTAENVQISTEAQGVAENASITTTTAETQNAGMESMRTEQGTVQKEKASANTEVLRDIQRSDDQKSLKDQIKANQETLNKMDPVAEVEVDDMSEMNKTEKTAYILGMYGKAFKNGIERSDVGFIEIGKKQIKAAYKYLHTDAEYMALAAVPDVIENGEIITDRANHKNRGYQTITLAAPVVLNGVRGNMAVTIQKTEQANPRYKVHRILMPDGSVFTLPKAEAEPTTLVRASKDERGLTISSASDKSIAEKEKDVKASNEKSSAKRALSLEEAEEQRKESFDALLKEEESKKEETPKQKTKTAEENKAEEAESEQEAEETRNYEEYKKAETEAFKAIEGFNFLPADIRYNITRMYMEMADVKDVTKATKKALASIMAVRPGLHIYASDRLADNGAYWISRNGMRVIVVSKNNGAVTNALLHEITHDLAKENSKHYENLSKAVLANTSDEDKQKVYDAYLMRHLRDYNQIDESTTLEEAKRVFKTFSEEDQKHFDDMVKEEITTRAVAEKLGQKNFLHEHGKEHRFAIMKAIAHLRKLGSSLVHRSEADKYVRQLEKNFAEAVGMGKSNVKIPSFVDIDEEDENHLTVMRSLESYLNAAHNEESGATRESGRDILLKYLTKTYGQGDAMQIVSQMDSIAEAMKAIESEHPELNIFSNWNSTQIEIDENGHPIFTTSVKNGDYELNQDFSRVCKKRRQLDYVLNYLAKNPDFRAEYLSKEDFVKINQAIKKHGFEIACDLCFVDAKRFRQAEWALSFENTWNDLFNSMFASGKVESFDFANGKKPSKTDVQFDESKPITYRKWSEGKATGTRSYASLEEFFKKDGNANVKAMARFMLNHPEARRKFVAKDIISSEGFDSIQRYNRELRSIFDGWGGTSVPKPSAGDTVYDNSIANLNQYNRETAFAMGGSRMNSFSDFMAHMFFDYCQAFSELAAKKMPVQSYTKELVFARLFGLTGAKINLSGVPAIRENASTKKKDEAFEKSIAGLNVDRLAEHLGKKAEDITQKEILANLDLCDYLWSKESINMKYATLLQSGIMYDRIMDESVIDECYSLIQEGKFDEAFALAGEENVNKEYAKNVGTIVVGVSEAHIRKLLRDNTVRMAIPYHKSGLNPIVARAMKIALYNDYTDTQSTRIRLADGSKEANLSEKGMQATFGIKDFDFYEYFGKKIGGKVVGGKAVAKRYLEWCKNGVYDEKVGDYVYYTKDGYILASEFHKKAEIVPKFSQFSNEKNYYKVLEDFDTYDSITNKHSAQNSITFNANSLPSDYRSVLTGALEAEQNTYEDFISAFNNETKLDGIGLGEEIMGIMDEARKRVEGEATLKRSINIEDRIISTHDERTRLQKGKDFVNTVRSRSAKENAQAAWTSAELAAIKLQILTTNAQAGIEHQLMAAGFAQDVVESATNMARMGARKGEAAITSAQTDLKGNIVGDSLMKRLAPALPNRKDFSLYMVHLLNIDRAPRGKAVFDGMTEEESRKEVARLEKLHPEFKDVAKELQEFDKNLLQLAVDARLISQEQADAYHKLNPHYFTIRRIKDGDPSTFKSGAFRVKDFSKSAKGGDDNIVDPIEAYIDHVTAIHRSAYINVVANAIYDTEDGVNVVSARDSIPNFDKKFEEEGRESLIGMSYREGIEQKSNTIVFFRDGEALAMNVSDEIMQGFKAMQGSSSYYFSTPLGKANTAAMRLFSKLVTTYNPLFIIRNAVRDFQDAGIYSRFGMRKFVKTYVTEAWREIANNGKFWQEYIANGAFDTSILEYSLGTRNEVSKHGLRKSKGNIFSKAATTFENMQLLVEQLPRFTEYLLSRKAGNDVQTSLYYAADVTVNFGRSGTAVKTLGKTVMPFLSSAFQGMSKNFRHFKDAARSKKAAGKLLFSAVVLGILPIVLSNMAYSDDEDYEILDDNLKSNYYLLKVGDKFIRVPRGRLASSFATVANTSMSQYQQKDFDLGEWRDSVDNILSQSTPMDSISRTIFSPILDAKTNTTWYGGQIESQAYDHVAPAERYDEYTSAIAKKLGQVFQYSPKKIDYLLDQYSGVIGDFLLPLTADTKKQESFLETTFSSLITDPTYSNKLSSKFYDMYDEVDWADDTLENYQIKKHLDKAKEQINKLYDEIDKINEDESISSADKVAQARVIRTMINRAYQTALEDYDLLKDAAKATSDAWSNVFTTDEITADNYRSFGLGKDDIGTYAVIYSNGVESYVAQTRDTEDDAKEYIDGALKRAAYADMVLLAYGAESALEAYSKDFYEKAQVANALGVDYGTMYNILSETRYLSGKEKKERVNEYLKGVPLTSGVKDLIKYLLGDTTKSVKVRAARALKNSDADEETKIKWLKKLK